LDLLRRAGCALLVLVLLCGLLGGAPASADEWTAPRPKSAPKGEAVVIPRDVSSTRTLPSARIRTRQSYVWPEESHVAEITFDAVASPTAPTEKGRSTFELAIDFGRVSQDGNEVGPSIRAQGAKVSVSSEIDEKGFVVRGTPKGADEGSLATLGTFARSAGSWVVPFLPKTPLRVGEAWELPLGYFLWSINQHGAAPPSGFVAQVVEAFEEHDGVRCARIRTIASIQRLQPKGMTPPAMRIGDGEALGRFRGEGTTWIGLDGCLREERLDVRMGLENTATKAGMEWRLHREISARPAEGAPWPKDWTRMTGGRPVAVGYEAGLAEGKLVGKPLMCLVLEYGDPDSEAIAYLTFHDAEAKNQWVGYLPVVVDKGDLGKLPNRDLVALLPGLLFLDLDGDVLFMMLGVSPPELFRTMIETAASRLSKHDPSPEYLALLAHQGALREARGPKKDVRAAVTAVLAIQTSGKGIELQAEARDAERALTLEGQHRVDDAVLLAAGGKVKEAKAALAAIAADYAGLPLAARAQAAAAALPAVPSKPK